MEKDTHPGAETKHIDSFKHVPIQIRSITLFLMGLVPVVCLLAIGTGAVPNLGVLEAATVDTIVTTIVLTILFAIPISGGFVRYIIYAITIGLTVWWALALHARYWTYYANTISISILMFVFLLGYIARIELIYRRRGTVLDYLHIQLKIDFAVMTACIAYYSFSSLFINHFAGVAKQITFVGFGCILLWAFTLWQVENRVAERLKLSKLSYLGLFLAAFVATMIELPAASLLNKVKVVRQPYEAPEESFRGQSKHPALKHPKAKSHGMNTTFSHTIIIILIICIVIAFIVFLIMVRKNDSVPEETSESEPGSMHMAKRERLSSRRARDFIQTDHPVRKQVQKWLRRLHKRGLTDHSWDTIRTTASEHQTGDIIDILNEYERIRYNPTSNSE